MDTQLYAIPIEGMEKYAVTKDGRVWSYFKNGFMSPKIINGYRALKLNGQFFTVSRLIAFTFLENSDPERLIRVMHVDGNYLNDHIDNLRWATQQECVTNTDKEICHRRKVHQIKNGIVINTYNSVTEAGAAVGRSRYAISKACLGINSNSAGYDWKYDDNEYEHEYTDLNQAVKIYDYDNYYVYPDGRIYNEQRKTFLKPVSKKSGYQYVTLSRNSKKKNYDIHRIVADHFLPKEEGCTQIDHLDMNKSNNHMDNLEWVTPSENVMRRNVIFNEKNKILSDEVSDTKSEEKSSDGPSQSLGEVKSRKIRIIRRVTITELELPIDNKSKVLVGDDEIKIDPETKPKIRIIRVPARSRGNNSENREDPQQSS